MEPITFQPLYMTRVWGGRTLETNYYRKLPDNQPYGESWELSDREHEQSLVAGGEFAGMTLNQLWKERRDEIFGLGLEGDRFPLLIKILDARDDLSIQVHPPVEIAASLGGDPKTEMWYIADCDPDAKLYIGFKNGVSRGDFEKSLGDGSVEEKVHAVQPKIGQSIFIPSGRLHAIGAGFLIYEIQQNSDTTYRVFDWNRVGLDGTPRDLHVEESMKSIDFDDFEPGMDEPNGGTLASCEYFKVDERVLSERDTFGSTPEAFAIVTVVSGTVTSQGGSEFTAGDFFLLPKGAASLIAQSESKVLLTTIPV
ncbi:class I mannose-6-phosphate isomerase [Akkermansiaceae bacterium]|nr:class I mannose-6-phosphate isomerase [bacterium]MDB4411959.1 class I mannose-6-phosphate isomerase [Akkermansiaceae bacterium]